MDEHRDQVNTEPPRDQEEDNGKTPLFSRIGVIAIGTIIIAVVAIYLVGVLVQSYTHETTDNAFLDSRVIAMASQVAGRVAQVLVEDNQRVKAGDVLVKLDTRDFEVALEQKRAAAAAAASNERLLQADLQVAEAQERSANAVARQSEADVSAAEATASRANADFERARSLLGNNTISQQEFDAARAAAQSAEANLKAAQEKAVSNQAKVGEATAQTEAARRAVQRGSALTRQAETDVKAAELNLSYTSITAPEDGQITKKAVQNGAYVQVGQRLFALVPNDLWVTANFKETQLREIRTNQPVVVTIDSVKHTVFLGHVQSIQAGSGAAFSMLPPENAVGNYVKVVQRVPVKIVFDNPVQSDHTLGPGMSVSPSVRIRNFELPEWATVLCGVLVALGLGAFWFRATRRKRERV